MKRLAVISALVAASIAGGAGAQYINGPAASQTMTAAHLRQALASAGFAPGASRDGFVLRYLSVSGSGQDFVVRLRIEPAR